MLPPPTTVAMGEAGASRLPSAAVAAARLSPGQIKLENIRQVGRYAICPIWCDGHSTGIYTYPYLRSLCQCPECAARREAQGAE